MTVFRIGVPLLVFFFGCSAPSGPVGPTDSQPQAAKPAPTAGMPKLADADVETVSGRIGTILDAGHYTYVRLDDDSDSRWVVAMGATGLSVGDDVAFSVLGQRRDFHSSRLDRDFSELIFGRLQT